MVLLELRERFGCLSEGDFSAVHVDNGFKEIVCFVDDDHLVVQDDARSLTGRSVENEVVGNSHDFGVRHGVSAGIIRTSDVVDTGLG